MILSVSRRTDIPAFYSEWLMNRLREGYVLVRNPMNYHQVSKVNLSPEVIDCIVFWTKNAAPLLSCLPEIRDMKYPFYFQYTLNAYDRDIEPCLPTMEHKLETFCRLSDQIGAKSVIWRYDPILLTEKYTIEWHIEQFRRIARTLQGKTGTCVFSFIDIYDKVKKNIEDYSIRTCTTEEMNALASAFADCASQYSLELRTCAESIDLARYGIHRGACVDGKLIAELIGWDLNAKKDQNQRDECGCIESIDIGQYNTCRHGCRYCYANFNQKSVTTLSMRHDPLSPFLVGHEEEMDKITERKMKSLKETVHGIQQLSLL